MKFENALRRIALGVIVMIPLAGCDSPKPSRRTVTSATGLSAVRDLSQDQWARKAIAAQTEVETGRAPGACVSTLLMDGKDLEFKRDALTEESKTHDALCSLEDKEIAHLLIESRGTSSAKTQGFALFIEKVTQADSVKGDLKYNSTHDHAYSEEFARYDVSIIRKHLCEDKSASSYKQQAVESFKSIISAATLEKYNACVRAKSYGFYCDASPEGDLVGVTLRWEPTEMVREILPLVALDWSGVSNLKTEAALPETLGLGSGYALSFTRPEPGQHSLLAVSVHDRGKNFNFACRVGIQPRSAEKPLKKGRFPECGIDLYREGSGVACGPKTFIKARSEACGIESHVVMRSRACGVEQFNSRHDCDICGQEGIFGDCKKCPHASFGVERYRECADPTHGVKLYAECEHKDHGVATYETCRDESFGVELYKECEVR